MKAIPAAALCALAVLAGATARAQDLDDPEPPADQVQARNGFALSESNFDMWIYGSTGNRAATAQDRLASLLAIHLDDVDRACRLSDAQKEKLRMAGRGDIKRFQDRVAAARKVFDQLKADQNRMGEIHQETIPLAALLRDGLFGEGSFFAKTVRTTLDPAQADLYRANVSQRDLFRYRAKIEATLVGLDFVVRFTDEQHRRLVALMLESTTPPKKWSAAQNDRKIVLIKMGQIPEAKIRPLFDDARWAALKRQLEEARPMAQILRAQGFLDAADAAEKKDR